PLLSLRGVSIAAWCDPGRRLESENLFLRHQLSIALRRAPPHLRLHRALLVCLASCGLLGILALEIAAAGRAAEDRSRVTRSHSTDEQGKPEVGSISEPFGRCDSKHEVSACRIRRRLHLPQTRIGPHRRCPLGLT